MTFQTIDTTIISCGKPSKPSLPEWMAFVEANHSIETTCPQINQKYRRKVWISLHTLVKDKLIKGKKLSSGRKYQRESIDQLEKMLQIEADIAKGELKKWCDNLRTTERDLKYVQNSKAKLKESANYSKEMAEYWADQAVKAQKELAETLNELNPKQESLEKNLSSLRNNPPKLSQKEIKKLRKWATRTIPLYAFRIPRVEIDYDGNLLVRH